MENISAALTAGIRISSHSQIVGSVRIQVTGGKGNTKTAAGFTGDYHIRSTSGCRNRTVVVENISTAMTSVIIISSHNQVGSSVRVQVTHGKGPAETAAGFTGYYYIRGRGGRGDSTVVVENISAALTSTIIISSYSQVGGSVRIQIAGGNGITEITVGLTRNRIPVF